MWSVGASDMTERHGAVTSFFTLIPGPVTRQIERTQIHVPRLPDASRRYGYRFRRATPDVQRRA